MRDVYALHGFMLMLTRSVQYLPHPRTLRCDLSVYYSRTTYMNLMYLYYQFVTTFELGTITNTGMYPVSLSSAMSNLVIFMRMQYAH
jgi:hypothetical protein